MLTLGCAGTPARIITGHLVHLGASRLRRARPSRTAPWLRPPPPDQVQMPAPNPRCDDHEWLTEMSMGSNRASADRSAWSAHDRLGVSTGAGAWPPDDAGCGFRRPWCSRTGRARRASRTCGAPPGRPVTVAWALTVPEQKVLVQPDDKLDLPEDQRPPQDSLQAKAGALNYSRDRSPASDNRLCIEARVQKPGVSSSCCQSGKKAQVFHD